MHRRDDTPGASGATGGDSSSVNALQQLIQDWFDADPSHTMAVLVQRGSFPSRNTIYAIMERDEPAGLPRKDTMERLAKGLGVPVRTVREAAEKAAGYGVEELDSESQEVQAWVALIGELPEDRRTELWEIGRMYLRRAKEEP